MTQKAELRIHKTHDSKNDDFISIKVVDKDAGIEFLNLSLSLEDFSDCILGSINVDCDMEVRGLKNVGKKYEFKRISFEVPNNTYWHGERDKELIKKIAGENTPEGWYIRYYFGAQTSMTYKDGKQYANTIIYRWVDK